MWIVRKKGLGCVAAVMLFVLLLCAPFVIEMAWHDYKLYKFAEQLDAVDDLLDVYDQKIGELTEISADSGSGDYCIYSAYRQYEISTSPDKHELLRRKLDEMRFLPAGPRADGADAKFFYVIDSWVLAVMIEDGPEPAIFDLRC